MSSEHILKYAMKQTKFKAKQLMGRYGFTKEDLEDLQQILLLEVVKRLPKFDGSRTGIKTFICVTLQPIALCRLGIRQDRQAGAFPQLLINVEHGTDATLFG